MFHCFMDICKQQGVHVIIYNQGYILSKQTTLDWLVCEQGLCKYSHFYLVSLFSVSQMTIISHHNPKTPCD